MKYSLIICFISIACYVDAQVSLGITIGGIGYHPVETTNNSFYKWNLDKKKKLVAFGAIGIALSYRYNDYIGLRLQQAIIFHDCAGKLAGVSHIGIELYDDIMGLENTVHEISASIGPLWYYRKGWTSIPEYKPDSNFMTLSKKGIWENKFVWYGGQIQYSYQYHNNHAFVANVLPGYPYLYTSGFGIRSRL